MLSKHGKQVTSESCVIVTVGDFFGVLGLGIKELSCDYGKGSGVVSSFVRGSRCEDTLIEADSKLLGIFDGLGLGGFDVVTGVEIHPCPVETGGGSLVDDEFVGISWDRLDGRLDGSKSVHRWNSLNSGQ